MCSAIEYADLGNETLTLVPILEFIGGYREAPWWNAVLYASAISDRVWLGVAYGEQLDSKRAVRWSASLTYSF